MRNILKIIGVALIVAVAGFSMASCRRGEGGGGGRAAALRECPASDFSFDLTSCGRGIIITRYTGAGGDVVIPSTIEDFPVLEIGPGAFRGGPRDQPNNRDLVTSIVVPDSVEVIGHGAFSFMDALTRVTLPDGLRFIPDSLFRLSRNLVSVNLPSGLEEIGYSAFHGCTELSELIIPDSLSSVSFVRQDQRFVAERQNRQIVRVVSENVQAGGSRHDLVKFIYPNNHAFEGCGKLPIRTRQRLQELGYEGRF